MSTWITTTQVRAVYSMLLAFKPYKNWSLPPVGTIRFELLAGPDIAEYSVDLKDRQCIAINTDLHTTLSQVIESVAHEMIHLRQDMLDRLPEVRDSHNDEFRRMARVVCRNLGFDVQRF